MPKDTAGVKFWSMWVNLVAACIVISVVDGCGMGIHVGKTLPCLIFSPPCFTHTYSETYVVLHRRGQNTIHLFHILPKFFAGTVFHEQLL